MKAFPLIIGQRQGYLFSLLLFTTVLEILVRTISQEKGNVVSMKKEETYFYEHRDNGNIVNKNQTKKIETFKKLKEE